MIFLVLVIGAGALFCQLMVYAAVVTMVQLVHRNIPRARFLAGEAVARVGVVEKLGL